jgi:regulatory protein
VMLGDRPAASTPRRDGSKRRSRASAKDRALGLLAVRWRSRDELRRRLRQAGYEPEEIEPALDDLEQVGLVEDGRFAQEVVRDQVGRRLAGDRAIRSALREKGVSSEIVERALAEAGNEDERAFELASRKLTRLRGLAPDAAYRRLLGQLLRRGYSPVGAREAVRRALREAPDAPDLDLPD